MTVDNSFLTTLPFAWPPTGVVRLDTQSSLEEYARANGSIDLIYKHNDAGIYESVRLIKIDSLPDHYIVKNDDIAFNNGWIALMSLSEVWRKFDEIYCTKA